MFSTFDSYRDTGLKAFENLKSLWNVYMLQKKNRQKSACKITATKIKLPKTDLLIVEPHFV